MKYIKKINELFKVLDPDANYNYDDVKELIDEFMDENGIMGSFSSGHYFKEPGGEHVSMLDDYLRKRGISLDKFMKDNMDEIMDDNFFVSHNGFMDYLLYCYDKKYYLSGGPMHDDIITKYRYGYHNYDLGKAYIKQNYESLSDYFEEYLDREFSDNKIDKDLYHFEKYDNSNIFVFVADQKAIDILDDSNNKGFEIGNGIYFFNLGTLGIENEDELAENFDYKEIVDELELKLNIKNYNV